MQQTQGKRPLHNQDSPFNLHAKFSPPLPAALPAARLAGAQSSQAAPSAHALPFFGQSSVRCFNHLLAGGAAQAAADGTNSAPPRRPGICPSPSSTNLPNGYEDGAPPPTEIPAQTAADFEWAQSLQPPAETSSTSTTFKISNSKVRGPPINAWNPFAPPPLHCDRSTRIRVQKNPEGASNLCRASAADVCSNQRGPADSLLLAEKPCPAVASPDKAAGRGGVAMPVSIRGRSLSFQTHSALESSRTPTTRAPESRLCGIVTGARPRSSAKRLVATHRRRAGARGRRQLKVQENDHSAEPCTRPKPPQCPTSRLCFWCKLLDREVCIVPCGHFGLCSDCGKDVSRKKRRVGKENGGEKVNSNEGRPGRVRACPVCGEEMVHPWVMDAGMWVALGGGFKSVEGDPSAEPEGPVCPRRKHSREVGLLDAADP